MDARQFLGLEATDDPLRWRLPVTPAVCTPGRFLYGGCGLAAGIVALEEASGRPTVWATAQYLAYAPTGSVLDWEVVLAATGHNTTQGRAIGRLGDEEVLTVNAALGRHDLDLSGTWVSPPDVPSPEDCPVQVIPPMFADTVLVRVDQRIARGRRMTELDGTPGDAHSASWVRVPGHLEPSAGSLAIIGDFVSGGVSQPLGVRTMGRSLDNTLRVAQLVPTEWVLCDIHMHALVNGFGQGLAHLWAQDGTLLGTASQSISVRRWPGDGAVLSGAALSRPAPKTKR
ncbi:MAG TPA: thioesterase family protein [Acidimicrobiales bacterium]|nr:thioesterase family protein [Acidimicrobiales bacterium]